MSFAVRIGLFVIQQFSNLESVSKTSTPVKHSRASLIDSIKFIWRIKIAIPSRLRSDPAGRGSAAVRSVHTVLRARRRHLRSPRGRGPPHRNRKSSVVFLYACVRASRCLRTLDSQHCEICAITQLIMGPQPPPILCPLRIALPLHPCIFLIALSCDTRGRRTSGSGSMSRRRRRPSNASASSASSASSR